MSVNIKEIKKILLNNFHEAKIEIIDTMGDASHLEILLVTDDFMKKDDIVRHKAVYDILGNVVGNEIHALSLKTYTHDEFKLKNKDNNYIIEDTEFSFVDYNQADEELVKLDSYIKSNNILLFMKGSKDMPMCGFSSQVNNILQSLDVEYSIIDVLSENKIREKIKEYASWPTIPQLYIKGKFIGGCNIITDMYNSGALKQYFKKNALL